MEHALKFSHNFTYKNNQLQSYEICGYNCDKGEFTKIVYNYENNQRTEQWYYILRDSIVKEEYVSILQYQNGKQTDFIREYNDGQKIISGEVCWDETLNKVHVRYSNFDKCENWTKSYFLTEKSKVFRSKRKVEYW